MRELIILEAKLQTASKKKSAYVDFSLTPQEALVLLEAVQMQLRVERYNQTIDMGGTTYWRTQWFEGVYSYVKRGMPAAAVETLYYAIKSSVDNDNYKALNSGLYRIDFNKLGDFATAAVLSTIKELVPREEVPNYDEVIRKAEARLKELHVDDQIRPPVEPSPLVKYYQGTGKDLAGRTIEDVLNFDNEQLEAVCDYIQWLFPTATPSSFNTSAPVLTKLDSTYFKDGMPRANLTRAITKMFDFYGLMITPVGRVVEQNTFEERSKVWLTSNNHNFLRITRIIESLTLLGYRDLANELVRYLTGIYNVTEHRYTIGTALFHWSNALTQVLQ